MEPGRRPMPLRPRSYGTSPNVDFRYHYRIAHGVTWKRCATSKSLGLHFFLCAGPSPLLSLHRYLGVGAGVGSLPDASGLSR